MFDHLTALEIRLSHEEGFLAAAKNENESKFRVFQIAQVKKEIAGEIKFLETKGFIQDASEFNHMSDDELLAALNA